MINEMHTAILIRYLFSILKVEINQNTSIFWYEKVFYENVW